MKRIEVQFWLGIILPSEFRKSSTGIDILIVQYQWESTQTTAYTSYYKGILFKVPDGTVTVDLFIPLDVKEPIEQELDQIIESISISN